MTIEDLPQASAGALDETYDQIEQVGEQLGRVRASIGRVIFGQADVIDETLITLLAGGHLLLVGVPGLAKTLLVETLGTVVGLDNRRIQCTPDLMPADIIGSEILDESEPGKRSFRFIRGPVFTQLLMADEINRANPRTQSALLQSMQENEVSVAGHTHKLPQPFHVLATQNPIEHEGTYPLPEAQLDRFLLQVNVDYPDSDAEREMLLATTGLNQAKAESVIDAAQLQSAQKLIRRLPVGETVVDAILKLVRSGRPGLTDDADLDRSIAWGPGPRASQALMLTCRARALLQGRVSPSIDDVIALAPSVLRHRMALNFAARADGLTIEAVIERLCQRLS
jgi:MoxR-like ATPase